MIGVLANAGAVVLGAFLGLLLKKGLPERLTDMMMKAVSLCVLFIGVTGVVGEVPEGVSGGKYTIVVIGSVVVGAVIGEALKLEQRFSAFTEKTEMRFRKGDGKTSLANGFITASLLFCVGAMTIVGSLESGIKGDNTTLFIKSMLDFFSSLVLAPALGVGVALSALFVFVFQGSIVLLSGLLAPVLTGYCIATISTVGSLFIIALSLNMMGLTKFRVMNFMPGILLPLVLCLI